MNRKEIHSESLAIKSHIKALLAFRHANRFVLYGLFARRRVLRAEWDFLDRMDDQRHAAQERYATTSGY